MREVILGLRSFHYNHQKENIFFNRLNHAWCIRYFSGNQNFEYRQKTSKSLENWEELKLYQPRVPHPYDYEWPKGAPQPLETTRERFHEFMRGKPLPFTKSFGSNLYRNIGFFLFGCISYAASRVMRGDDLQWVDEERKRLSAAKKKLERIKRHQEKQKRLLAAKAIDTQNCPETSEKEST